MMPGLVGDEKWFVYRSNEALVKTQCINSVYELNLASNATYKIELQGLTNWTCLPSWYILESSWKKVFPSVCSKFLVCVHWDGKIYFIWVCTTLWLAVIACIRNRNWSFTSLLLTADAIWPAAICSSCCDFSSMIGFTLKVWVKIHLYSLVCFCLIFCHNNKNRNWIVSV